MHFGKIKRVAAIMIASCTLLSTVGAVPASAGELFSSVNVGSQVTALGETSTYAVPYVDKIAMDSTSSGTLYDTKTLNYTTGSSSYVFPITATSGYLTFQASYSCKTATDALRFRIFSDAECQTTPLDESAGTKITKDEDGELVAGKAVVGARIATAGTYYICIDAPTSTAAATYAITYSGMVNPILLSNQTLTLNDMHYFYNADSLTTAYYKLSLPSAGALEIIEAFANPKDTDYLSDDSYGVSTCQILNSKKTAIPNYKITEDSMDGTAVLDKGTYYLKMTGMKYRQVIMPMFTKYKVSSGGTSKSSAITATNGTRKYSILKLTGKISGSSWFKFKVGSEKKDKLSLGNVNGDRSVKYKIYRGKKVVKSGSVSSMDSKTITFSPSSKTWKKGTYYIRFYKPSKTASSVVSVKRTVTK